MNNRTTLSIGAAIASTLLLLRFAGIAPIQNLWAERYLNTYPISISQYYYECLSRKSISSSFSSHEDIDA